MLIFSTNKNIHKHTDLVCGSSQDTFSQHVSHQAVSQELTRGRHERQTNSLCLCLHEISKTFSRLCCTREEETTHYMKTEEHSEIQL